MKYKVGDIVEITNWSVAYCGAIGEITAVCGPAAISLDGHGNCYDVRLAQSCKYTGRTMWSGKGSTNIRVPEKALKDFYLNLNDYKA